MKVINTILSIVFPVNCIACGKSGKDLCLECFLKFPVAERGNTSWIFPLYDYRYPIVKKSIWFLKYKSKKRFGKIFAEALYGKILGEFSNLS